MKYKEEISYLINNKYKNININKLFREDSKRFTRYQVETNDIFLDFSKNRINKEIFEALIKLANNNEFIKKRNDMFYGKNINISEKRAVLHTALRDLNENSKYLEDKNIKYIINQERIKVKNFVESIHKKIRRGFSGKVITEIVNIGIGGSYLGPKMVIHALKDYLVKKTNVHFISNIDIHSITEILNKLNPEKTLFIISSKSFTTEETLMNAKLARQWLLNHFKDLKSIEYHFIAISNELKLVKDFGIKLSNCFKIWDWVGGRYSLWSSAGIAIIFAIGFERYMQILEGANVIDIHFKETSLGNNMPVILALLGILYNNFYNFHSQAIISYDDRLLYLTEYLQQTDMESNGKSYCNDGNLSKNHTGTILWGGIGTNYQHTFGQLLHQGTITIPTDFIMIKHPNHKNKEYHQTLLSNCIAQTQALMQGRMIKNTKSAYEKEKENKQILKSKFLPYYKIINGNKPSNTILLNKLTPKSLGSLISLYEHKIFTQGVIWNINSFDQWGVELGKKLSKNISYLIKKNKRDSSIELDQSTLGLINKIK